MHVPESGGEALRSRLVDQYAADFIIYNPSRQHWSEFKDVCWEKGNDVFIRGFAKFVKNTNPNAMVVFTEWGESVSESKKLLEDLGVAERVEWVAPVPHKRMIEYIQASDIISDQFLIGTFGGIPAKA